MFFFQYSICESQEKTKLCGTLIAHRTEVCVRHRSMDGEMKRAGVIGLIKTANLEESQVHSVYEGFNLLLQRKVLCNRGKEKILSS